MYYVTWKLINLLKCLMPYCHSVILPLHFSAFYASALEEYAVEAICLQVRRPPVRYLSVRFPCPFTYISRDAICLYVFSGGISMKLGTNIHHVSGRC